MCGISGLADFSHRSQLDALKDMTDIMSHRGPDDSGYSLESLSSSVQIGVGHRRLSILDLSKHGHQPMNFKHLTMVYNGEVYNFKEIRDALEELGYQFESQTDTEVILKAYHYWGVGFTKYLNGMFAIAILDRQNFTLTLVRDRVGVKPLFWYQNGGLFLFASELKSFHEHPEFKKELNLNSVGLYLQYGYIPQPHTIFKNAYKLQAGHSLVLNLKNAAVKIEKYWDIIDSYNKPKLSITNEEAILETERLMQSAFEYRMASDVPVGIFLSGGYDSSVLTAMLQKERSDKLKTFTIGFFENEFNEAHHAKRVADYLGTDHTEVYCTENDALEIFPSLAEIWDEPLADNSTIPTIFVSKLAKEQVTVCLSADGGDEVFGGYSKYLQAERYFNFINKIPQKFGLASILSRAQLKQRQWMSPSFYGKYHRALSLLSSCSQNEMMENLQKTISDSELANLLSHRTTAVATCFNDIELLRTDLPELDKLLAIDFKTYQLDDILAKVDRATMSVSLEGREPLLDYRIAEFVARLDANLKVNQGDKKYLLKQVSYKYLPQEMMDRPKKGFSIPVSKWLETSLRGYVIEYLDRHDLQQQGVFNVNHVLWLKNRFLLGDSSCAPKIWRILVFQAWYARWM